MENLNDALNEVPTYRQTVQEKLPSDFRKDPYGSLADKSEAETVARNIMCILTRTGNVWRELTPQEYKAERLKDEPYFNSQELAYFDRVISYCVNADAAQSFSPAWR